MIVILFLVAGIAVAADPLVCSVHGQAHVLMTDGSTRYTLNGAGLAEIFSTTALSVQCDFNQTSAQSVMTSCRFLITSTTSSCSVDILHGNQPGHVSIWGQTIPVTSLEEFVSANVDPALGLACHAIDDNTITIEITQRDTERFILIESSLQSLTITTSNVTSCSGACGTCQGPQTAPRAETIAVMPFRAIHPQRRCGAQSSSSIAPQLPAVSPYTENAGAVPLATFASPETRNTVIAECSGHDQARLVADSLFSGFVEACADDIATGASPATAKSNMDSFVNVIENRQKVEMASDALRRNPSAIICAACMSVEWDNPINTTSVLDAVKALNSPSSSQRAKSRSMYKKVNSAPHNLYEKKTGSVTPSPQTSPSQEMGWPKSSTPETQSPSAVPAASEPSSSDLKSQSASPHKQPLYEHSSKPAVEQNEDLTALKQLLAPSPSPSGSSGFEMPTTVPTPVPTGYDALPATMRPTTSSPSTKDSLTPKPDNDALSSKKPLPSSSSMPTTSPLSSPMPSPLLMPTMSPGNSTLPAGSQAPTPFPTPSGNETRPQSNQSSPVPTTQPSSTASPAPITTESPTSVTFSPVPSPFPTSSPSSGVAATWTPVPPPSPTPAPTTAPSSAPTGNATLPQTSVPTSPPSGSKDPVLSTNATAMPASMTPSSMSPSTPTSMPNSGNQTSGITQLTSSPMSQPSSSPVLTTSPTASPANVSAALTTAPGSIPPSASSNTLAASSAPTSAPTVPSSSNISAASTTAPPVSSGVPLTSSPAASNVSAASAPPQSTTPVPTPPSTLVPNVSSPWMPSYVPMVNFTTATTPVVVTPAPTNNGTSVLGASMVPDRPTNSTRPPITAVPINLPFILSTPAPQNVAVPARPLSTVAATVPPSTAPLTGRGSVYGCHCNMSTAALKDSLDKVQYALDSYLVDALAKSVLNGEDHDLLTVIACGLGGPNNAKIKALSISEFEATNLCRQCELSSKDLRQPSVPSSVGSVTAVTNSRRTRNIGPSSTTPLISNDAPAAISILNSYPTVANPISTPSMPLPANGLYPSRETLSAISNSPAASTGSGIYPNREMPSMGNGVYPNRDAFGARSSSKVHSNAFAFTA